MNLAKVLIPLGLVGLIGTIIWYLWSENTSLTAKLATAKQALSVANENLVAKDSVIKSMQESTKITENNLTSLKEKKAALEIQNKKLIEASDVKIASIRKEFSDKVCTSGSPLSPPERTAYLNAVTKELKNKLNAVWCQYNKEESICTVAPSP